MKREVRLYNMMMPIWLVVVFPITWIPVLISNFLIDTVVVAILLNVFDLPGKMQIWKKSIVKIWLFGMISDIIGGGCMFFGSELFNWAELDDISQKIDFDPFGNVFSLLFVLLCMALTSVIIYFLDSRLGFRKTGVEKLYQKKMALWISTITTPWLFLFPSGVLYNMY